MPDYTPEQVEAALREPKPGDVWEKGTVRRCVSGVYPGGPFLCQKSVRGKIDWLGPTHRQFQQWTRNATLVRRGA